MFKSGKIVLLFVTLQFMWSCKKDISLEPPCVKETINFNCGRSSFIDTITVNLNNPSKICSSISGNNNIYVATLGTTTLDVVKMDCDANYKWKKSYNYGTEKVVYVSALGKYDDFYVLTATDNFTVTGGVDTVKAWISYWENFSPTTISCDRSGLAYTFNTKLVTDQEQTALPNYSRLYKYDGAGNLQWQKNLNGNYFDNTALSADTNNNIYVLTATKKSYTPFEVFTFTTSIYPSFAVPLDSNGFTVTKIDPFGNQVSSQTINKVYSRIAGDFNPALSISASNVNVICSRDVYVFDMNVNYVNKISPVSVNCVNKQMAPLNNPHVVSSFFHLLTSDGISNNYFFETYVGTSMIGINTYSEQQNINWSPCMDEYKNIYFARTNYIEKFDSYGNRQYHKNLSFSPFSLTCLTSKVNQVFLFDYEGVGNLYIVRPDANGNY